MTDDQGNITGIELASTDELLNELRKRCVAGIIFIAYADEGGDRFQAKTWGSMFWRLGVAKTMVNMFQRLSDNLVQEGAEGPAQ